MKNVSGEFDNSERANLPDAFIIYCTLCNEKLSCIVNGEQQFCNNMTKCQIDCPSPQDFSLKLRLATCSDCLCGDYGLFFLTESGLHLPPQR